MDKPKYDYGDVVRLKFVNKDNEPIEGMIQIIDQQGTFRYKNEPSYDIYCPANNVLYKHVGESLVDEFIRHGRLSEYGLISPMIPNGDPRF